ncbi:unnamed protein product [Closterium sp. Naga37s-1]|nr:unnamed protein product [Closterium sp. Naga37s-1]
MAGPVDGAPADDDADDIEVEIARTGLDLLLCSLSKPTIPPCSKNPPVTSVTAVPTVTSAPPDSIVAPVIKTAMPTNVTDPVPTTVPASEPSTPAAPSPTSPMGTSPSLPQGFEMASPSSRPVPPASQPAAPEAASPAGRPVPPASHPHAAASASPAARLVQTKLNFLRPSSAPPTAPTNVPTPPVLEAAASNQPSVPPEEQYAIALEREALAAKDAAESLPVFNMIDNTIRRTTGHLEARYVDCGDEFGGGLSPRLSPWLEKHGPEDKREVCIEGSDSDGQACTFTFILHEDKLDDYPGPGHQDACIDICTEFAELIVANLLDRLGDLDKLLGVGLFTPDNWPHGRHERQAKCQEHLEALITLFRAEECEEIIPGVDKKKAVKEVRLLIPVLSRAPKVEIWRNYKKRKPLNTCNFSRQETDRRRRGKEEAEAGDQANPVDLDEEEDAAGAADGGDDEDAMCRGECKLLRSLSGITVRNWDVPIVPSYVGGECNPLANTDDDPHFRGADGTRFDFNGILNRSFCLVSDRRIHINMGIKGYQPIANLPGTATSLDEESLVAALEAAANEKKPRHIRQLEQERLSVEELRELERMRANGSLPLTGEVVAALDRETGRRSGEEGAGGGGEEKEQHSIQYAKHELKARLLKEKPIRSWIRELQHTSGIHGVLGQTFRAEESRKVRSLRYRLLTRLLREPVEVESESGRGFLDGRTEDYITSDIRSADCMYAAAWRRGGHESSEGSDIM